MVQRLKNCCPKNKNSLKRYAGGIKAFAGPSIIGKTEIFYRCRRMDSRTPGQFSCPSLGLVLPYILYKSFPIYSYLKEISAKMEHQKLFRLYFNDLNGGVFSVLPLLSLSSGIRFQAHRLRRTQFIRINSEHVMFVITLSIIILLLSP